MIPQNLLQMKDELQRSSLLSGALNPKDTFATISFIRRGHTDFSSRIERASALSQRKLKFRREFASRERYVAMISIWRYSSGQPVLFRRFQLRVPKPFGLVYNVDLSLTAFSRIVQMYDTWASTYLFRRLRLPWAPSASRPSPETSSLIRLEAWYEGDTQRSYAEVPYTNYQRVWGGVRTPGFKKLKKRDLPVNNYQLTLLRRGHYGEYIHNTHHDSGGNLTRDDQFWNAFSVPGGDLEPSFKAGLDDNAVKRLSVNAQSNATSNIALNVAQIQLTVGMITQSATRIAGSLRALKSGNFSLATKLLWRNQRPKMRGGAKLSSSSSLANNWLELQYGWKPLLSDVRGSMEALARFNFANSAIKQVAASASFKQRTSDPIRTNDSMPTTVGSFVVETNDVCRYILRYRLASPLTAFLAQTGFTNPVNLAWELIPFSFVVDWFLPIGPYLETLSQWDGLEFLDGVKINFLRKTSFGRTYFSGKYNASDPGWHTERYGLYSSFWLKHVRTKLNSFPYANLPQARMGLNTTRALNAVALLRTTFGK